MENFLTSVIDEYLKRVTNFNKELFEDETLSDAEKAQFAEEHAVSLLQVATTEMIQYFAEEMSEQNGGEAHE